MINEDCFSWISRQIDIDTSKYSISEDGFLVNKSSFQPQDIVLQLIFYIIREYYREQGIL